MKNKPMYEYTTLEDLEKLIGKHCDILFQLTGKIVSYDMFITGVHIQSGYTESLKFMEDRIEKSRGFIHCYDCIDCIGVMRNIFPIETVTNVRDKRLYKGTIPPDLVKMVKDFHVLGRNE